MVSKIKGKFVSSLNFGIFVKLMNLDIKNVG